MESYCTDLIVCTLPDHLKEEGKQLIAVSKNLEEERLKSRGCKYRKHIYNGLTDQESNGAESEDTVMNRTKIARENALPIAVAKLVMELWSPRMRRHAESLILKRAVQEGYIKEHQLKWIYVLESTEKELVEDNWVINYQDGAIAELLWEKFNLKEHFDQVNSHRMWIQRSYDRLKDFMPTLSGEIIERHDLSKFAFSQAIGYTLKWVHNTYHSIWKTACDLHLHNEPHHPQTWSKAYTEEEKYKKLEIWLKNACDSYSGCPYGIDVVNLDLSTEDLAEPFLLESFVDMVGVEWERKKGQQLDITTRELVYMDDRFLNRYSKKQHQFISELIERIVASDESWKRTMLSEREKLLISTLPKTKHSIFVCQREVQKKYEEKRLIRIIKKEEEMNGDNTGIVLSQEMTDKADDNAFFIMVSKVVMEMWGTEARNLANKIILKKAVEEKLIDPRHVSWIMIIDKQDEESKDTSSDQVFFNDEVLVKLLWEYFKLRDHFLQVQCHRHWVRQSYQRLARFMPELTEEVIERHDLTKFALVQSIGYTLKWIHDLNYSIWRKSCDQHLNYEPHHPQLWSNKHTPEYKKYCLELWLCAQDGNGKYGVDLLSLDLTTENMAKVFLLESLVDMVAVEWERNKNQKLDLTYTELIYMEDRFLTRYTDNDRTFILQLMEEIRKADVK